MAVGPGPERPTGTVTFLFTDIEGSTRLLRELGERYAQVRADHDRLLRDAAAAHGGEEVDTQGDSFFFSFRRAKDGVAAAADAQRALAAHPWPDGSPLRVRMGLHSGEPAVGEDGRYVGLSLHRAARISSAARGGQVLLSSTTADLVSDNLPEGVTLRELGRRPLKDFDRPERVSQLMIDGLQRDFRPVRTEANRRRRRRALLAVAVLIVAGAIAGSVVALTAGSDTPKPVAVAANSVAVIDPDANRVVADVPVGTNPSVAVGAGGVWTANTADGTLSRIDPKTYVAKTHAFASSVSGIAFGFGSVWAANPVSGTVVPINPTFASAGKPIRVSSPLRNGSGGFSGAPGAIAIGFGSIWVSVEPPISELIRVDPATGAKLATFEDVYNDAAVDSAGEVAVGPGGVWAASPGNYTMLSIDPTANLVVDRIRISSGAGAIAGVEDATWVTVPRDNTIWRIGLEGTITATTAVGTRPTGIAVGEGAVWVANSLDGTVSRIDPKTNQVVATIKIGHSPASVAVGYGRVWVAVRA
jgi:YVTN family beta-propeller protein